MPTLEELRQKRIQELKNRESSGGIDDAREKRIQELRSKKSTFIETPEGPSATSLEPESSSLEAFRRSIAVNVLPTAGGFLTGAATGAAAGTLGAGPIGTVLGFIGGGITGAIISKKAQDKALEVVKGEEWKRNLDQSLAEDRAAHPYATLLGEATPQLIAFKPSPSTLKQAFNFGKRALTDPKSLSKHIKTLEGKTELDALMNVSIGAGVDVSLETYQQAREGDINALRIIGAGVLGGTISDPNRIGVKLGFSPTGDAVIDEYNKFGSQTPAAKIITKGEVPVIDRSSDAIVKQRRELSAILRGEGEANRFTEPRILQAERIAGTIDKDVTPDSDLNIYRLDGRSGPMRVGERVTANPFIADVYGGRINPEGVVKAGDLVRTSEGDYVYAPKDQVSATPVLPPVTKAVEPEVAKEVTTKEATAIKETKAKEAEAVRLAEEPARLQREAEARYEKEIQENQKRAIKLQEDVKKIRAKKQADIASEKVKFEKQKQSFDKTRDQGIESITKELRKNIDKAILDHAKRMQNTTTKLQKTKEGIRFKNQKARLTAKAIKDKKKLRAEAEVAKRKIENATKSIRREADTQIKSTQKEIKELQKPKPMMKAPAKAPRENTLASLNKVAKNSLVNTPVGIREKSLEYFRKNPSEISKGEVRLRELEDGSIYIEDGRHRLKVASETGIKPNIVDVTAEYTGKASDKIAEIKKDISVSEASVSDKVKAPAATPKTETAPTVAAKPEPEKKVLIGTKQVKSASLIKNAIQDAKENSNLAQRLDENVTSQMGTTFVEQRRLSAELLADRGIDDTLKFATESTDTELSKFGINRSALYETLYKTIIKEEQFAKYRDELEALAIEVSDEVSIAAQTSSLARLATQNDPFRRVAAMKKALIEKEKKVRGSVFKNEVDELYAKLSTAGSLDDIKNIIKDNRC